MANALGMHRLTCHPLTPARSIEAVSAHVLEFSTNTMMVEFNVRAALELAIPPETGGRRADGLWRTTCFEVFLQREDGSGYFEFNFSPSFAWAAYEFTGYREGMQDLPVVVPPEIEISLPDDLGVGPEGVLEPDVSSISFPDYFFLAAEFETSPSLLNARMVGLSAVLEEKSGIKSYWALAHPPSGPPDFHHPDCFTLELPPPGEP